MTQRESIVLNGTDGERSAPKAKKDEDQREKHKGES